METLDIMLDLETLGVGNSPVITQIAAVAFDITNGAIFGEFDTIVSQTSCIMCGLDIDQQTVDWWLQQDPKVQQAVYFSSMKSDKEITTALGEFSNWLENTKSRFGVKNVRIWGNGCLADNKWLESAYLATDIKIPYKYNSNCDVRTLVDLGKRILGKDIKKEIEFQGEKHNALDDCKHQIKYCTEIFRQLRGV